MSIEYPKKRPVRFFNTTGPAYLVIFDRRPETRGQPWEERLSWQTERGITVIGC